MTRRSGLVVAPIAKNQAGISTHAFVFAAAFGHVLVCVPSTRLPPERVVLQLSGMLRRLGA